MTIHTSRSTRSTSARRPTGSDAELAARAQAGDGEALAELISRYRRFARAKARQYFLVGGDAEDVEQEALIGLYKAARDFCPSHVVSFRSFADLCITRQIITAIKAATRQKHQPLNQYVSLSEQREADDGEDRSLADAVELDADADPVDAVLAHERTAALRVVVRDRLSPLEVEVLFLYVEGTSYQEIGELLDRRVKSVDNAIQRIKRKLEPALAVA